MIFLYVLGTWTFLHFLHPFTFPSEIIENIASIPIGILAYLIAVYINIIPPIKRGDKRYLRYAGAMGSMANYALVEDGWARSDRIKKWSNKNMRKAHINLNNFIFSTQVKEQLLFFSFRSLFHDKPVYIPIVASDQNGEDAVLGMTVYGIAGGGKSQFLLNIFSQKKYNRSIVHDVKGEFVKYFYREDKDIILNSFDERGAVWDIFAEAEESPVAIMYFFETYIQNGMNKDFWTSATVLNYKNLFHEVQDMPLTSIEKWQVYNESIDNLITEYEKSGDRVKTSLAQVMAQIKPYFDLQVNLLNRGAKTFTINHFKNTKDMNIFLLNDSESSFETEPVFSAVLSVMVAILGSKEDKTDITLLLIDEYLSFAGLLIDATRRIMHTRLRSAGVMTVTALQSLPDDEKTKKDVWSNNSYFIFFPSTDAETNSKINTLIGDIDYYSKSESSDGKTITTTYTKQKANIVDSKDFQRVGKVNYGHITFVPQQGILYIGKNDLYHGKEMAERFVKNKNIYRKVIPKK